MKSKRNKEIERFTQTASSSSAVEPVDVISVPISTSAADTRSLEMSGFLDPCGVADDYTVRDRYIEPRTENRRWCAPIAHKELPGELYVIAHSAVGQRDSGADDASATERALAFVRQWGYLDSPLLYTPVSKMSPEKHSIDNLITASETIGTILALIKNGELDQAMARINAVVGGRRAGISLVRRQAHQGEEPPPLEWAHRFRTLKAVVYWHLGNIAVSKKGVGRCKECARYFAITDRRMLFCPPSYKEREFATGRGIRSESKCSLRYRQRQAR